MVVRGRAAVTGKGCYEALPFRKGCLGGIQGPLLVNPGPENATLHEAATGCRVSTKGRMQGGDTSTPQDKMQVGGGRELSWPLRSSLHFAPGPSILCQYWPLYTMRSVEHLHLVPQASLELRVTQGLAPRNVSQPQSSDQAIAGVAFNAL